MILYELQELSDGALILCSDCKGKGDYIKPNKYPTSSIERKCKNCGGAGLVIIKHKKIAFTLL